MSDYKNNIEPFLNGELNIDKIKLNGNKDYNADFVKTYKTVINETNNKQLPDFNPFEKIDLFKKKKFLIVKRMLPYAAIILFAISFFVILQNNPTKNKYALSDKEIAQLQHNTEQALLHFSKELNACIAEIDKALKTRQPFAEMYSINHFKIEFDNPTKNLKIN